MGILRLANRDLKKINLDEDSYIEVATDISKREFNTLALALPEDIDENKGISMAQGIDLTAKFFNIFVKGWSLDVAPTEEAYLELPRDAADAIDAALMAHFASLQVGEPEAKKSKR